MLKYYFSVTPANNKVGENNSKSTSVTTDVSTVLDTSKVRNIFQKYFIHLKPNLVQIQPSSYMKASVQFPPYKSYDSWRQSSSSLSPVRNTEHGHRSNVRTMVEHYNDETDQSRAGTRTVTRTITPTGEMSVYASQSSVRFKMTSKTSLQQSSSELRTSHTLPRHKTVEHDSDDGCRDLYPSVTTLRKTTSPARSVSLKESSGDHVVRRSQCLPSPNFNIVHRDTERSVEVGDDEHDDDNDMID